MTALDELVDREEIMRLHRGPWKKQGEWLMAFCPVPAHSDGQKHSGNGGQSLGLSDSGVLKCFAGCAFKDIMESLRGSDNKSRTAARPVREPTESLVKVYQYKDRDGVVVAEKGRFEAPGGHKSFRWRRPGADSWPGGITVAELPLYGPELLGIRTDDPVYFVEGEKAADACREHGLLAVTTGGGAGQRDFGKSLDDLRGREVRLWSDNDGPGRAFILMVQARLAGVAAAIHTVNVPIPLPEKGDAFDYFSAGGDVDQLDEASPTEPVAYVLASDHVRVVMPTFMGAVSLDFAEMEKTARSLDARVTISCVQSQERPYEDYLNLQSAGARTDMRRDLDNVYGKDFGWTKVLNTAVSLARDTFLQQDRSRDIFDIPDTIGDILLVPPLVVADGPTIFFGDGAALKSYFLFLLALCMGSGLVFMHFQTPTLPVLIIDYEDSEANVRRRFKRLIRGLDVGMDDLPPDAVHYWPANGIPLKDQVEAIRTACERNGIGLIIVDSAAPACGGDPSDPQVTLALFRALKRIGLPSILIAHTTKSGDTKKPFGSAFWHYEARRTWYVARVQEEDSDELDVGLFARKANDGRLPLPLAFHASFEGTDGPVKIRLGAIDAVPELMDQTNDRQRLWAELERPRSIPDLARALGLTADQVEKLLRRGPFVVAGQANASGRGRPATLWARKEERPLDQVAAQWS